MALLGQQGQQGQMAIPAIPAQLDQQVLQRATIPLRRPNLNPAPPVTAESVCRNTRPNTTSTLALLLH